jgi:hypothetical protein
MLAAPARVPVTHFGSALGQEWYRRKRTLQRRVEQWKALHGPSREVMFLQQHQPGVLGISDFTQLKGDPITIAGVALEHRLFHFRLPYSGWCHVEVIHGGESFVALAEALQNALAGCGGVPAEHRTVSGDSVFSFLRTVVMNLLRRGGYRSIRQGFRELAYDIKGMLALGGVRLAQANSE